MQPQTVPIVSKSLTRSLWGIAFVLLLLQIRLLLVRVYDPDELQHLHAAYCVAQGQVPYRDFFEHHGPITYYLGAIPVALLGPTLSLLTINRLLSLAFMLATLLLTYGLTARLYNHVAALATIVYLLSFHWFVDKAVEWRPDSLALTFIVGAALLLLPRRAYRHWPVFLSGVLLGLATLCTPKVAFLCIGMAAGAVVTASARRQQVVRFLLSALLGGAAPWVMFGMWFMLQGAENQFIECLILNPINWPTQIYYVGHLQEPVGGAPLHVAAGIFALFYGGIRICRHGPRANGEAVLVLPIACHWFAMPFVPNVYLQFFVLALPFTAALTTGTASLLWSSRNNAEQAHGKGWTLLLLWCSSIYLLDMANIVAPLRYVGWQIADLVGVCLLIVGGLLLLLHRRLAVLCMIAAMVLPSLARVVRFQSMDNATQRRDLALVHHSIQDDETVLDGGSYYACLRPHLGYWWWINLHNVELAASSGGLEEIAVAVRARAADVIMYDSVIRQYIEPLVGEALFEGYRAVKRQPSSSSGVVLLRRIDAAQRAGLQ